MKSSSFAAWKFGLSLEVSICMGPETLAQVAEHSQTIAASLDGETGVPFKVVFKPVLTTPEQVRALCREANNEDKCIA